VLADVAPTVAGGSNISWTGWTLEGILVLVVGALLLAALRFMFRATLDKLLATSKDTNERHAQSAASAAKDAAQAAAQAATGVARIEAHLGAQDTTIGLLAAALKTD
jgi:divalent metal cation (Fe/Co/Zn/Cd) transporter